MKNVVITGCSSGIGEGTAVYLVENYEVLVIGIARNEEKLNRISEKLSSVSHKGRFVPLPFDLSDIDGFPKLLQDVSNYAREIHTLINNAGAIVNKEYADISPGDFSHVMSTNFKTPFFLIQSFLPLFSKPAHIVNITSMGGFQGSVKFPGLSVYSASKAALSCLTECLATELSDSEIFVNAVAPGAVQTEMLSKVFPGYQAPLTPEQIGEFVGYFALHGHNYFNGKIIPVSLSTP